MPSRRRGRPRQLFYTKKSKINARASSLSASPREKQEMIDGLFDVIEMTRCR
ncbi:MAG: hypothetical protein ACE5F1_06720 [Planctomycetota bacterium]